VAPRYALLRVCCFVPQSYWLCPLCLEGSFGSKKEVLSHVTEKHNCRDRKQQQAVRKTLNQMRRPGIRKIGRKIYDKLIAEHINDVPSLARCLVRAVYAEIES
jgi:hypothetical protein